jgi:Tfp pilus assembly protein PilO
MSRQTTLLAVLGAILLVVAFYFLAWAPKSDEIEELEAQIDTVLAQQTQTRSRIVALEEVRARAPEIEADLGAVEALVPTEVAYASVVRQLQLAADDSGVTLITIQPGRPSATGDGLATISLNLSLRGSYFQVVDLLRRIEDPAITARGILFDSAALAVDEYPELSVSLSGRMFALLDAPAAPAPAPSPSETATEDGGDA